jgi:hypothetical protein
VFLAPLLTYRLKKKLRRPLRRLRPQANHALLGG